VVDDIGRPIANAFIHVRNDTSGRDVDHDVTSGELAEQLPAMYVANVTCTSSADFVTNRWNVQGISRYLVGRLRQTRRATDSHSHWSQELCCFRS